MANDDFLGTGWAFPLAFENQGRVVRMATGEADIRQSLQILLATELGERVMQPAFGWRRETLVFEPLSTAMATSVREAVKNAILFYEPRIDIVRISLETDGLTEGRIDLRVDYIIRATNTRTNLVFPFYLDEATDTDV
jgi:phage baseplate assembly protein W